MQHFAYQCKAAFCCVRIGLNRNGLMSYGSSICYLGVAGKFSGVEGLRKAYKCIRNILLAWDSKWEGFVGTVCSILSLFIIRN